MHPFTPFKWRACVCVCVRACKNGYNTPPSTHARTHISRECDLLAITSIFTTGFRLNESDQTGAKVHFLPRSRPRPARTQMPNLPHAPEVWVLPPNTLRSTFRLLFLPLPDTLRNSGRGGNRATTSEPNLRSNSTFLRSSHLESSPPASLSLSELFRPERRPRSSEPGRNLHPPAVRFGSVLPSGEMSTKARSAAV